MTWQMKKYISFDTVIQMYNGDTKLAKNIKIGDEIISCDGNKNVINKKTNCKWKNV